MSRRQTVYFHLNNTNCYQNTVKSVNKQKFFCLFIAFCGFYTLFKKFISFYCSLGKLYKNYKNADLALFIAFYVNFFVNYVLCGVIKKYIKT